MTSINLLTYSWCKEIETKKLVREQGLLGISDSKPFAGYCLLFPKRIRELLQYHLVSKLLFPETGDCCHHHLKMRPPSAHSAISKERARNTRGSEVYVVRWSRAADRFSSTEALREIKEQCEVSITESKCGQDSSGGIKKYLISI